MKTRSCVRCTLAFVVLLAGAALVQASYIQVAADDFNRADSYSLGTTSVGGYTWATSLGGPSLSGNQVWGDTRTNSYEALVSDLNVANGLFNSDLTFNLTNGAANEGVSFAAYYIMRKSTTAPGMDDGSVQVRVCANGALLIQEDVGGTINELYNNDPFEPGYHFSYAKPGDLPATINGAAFDTAQKGYLDHDGNSGYADTFRFGVSLSGTGLSVLYNGQTVVTKTLTGSGNSGNNIFAMGRASGEFIYAGFTDGNVGYDNLSISAEVPEPSVLTLLATGIVGVLVYAWRKRR